jgi:hypothetical protein
LREGLFVRILALLVFYTNLGNKVEMFREFQAPKTQPEGEQAPDREANN